MIIGEWIKWHPVIFYHIPWSPMTCPDLLSYPLFPYDMPWSPIISLVSRWHALISYHIPCSRWHALISYHIPCFPVTCPDLLSYPLFPVTCPGLLSCPLFPYDITWSPIILLFPNDILLALIASLVAPWHALISYHIPCFPVTCPGLLSCPLFPYDITWSPIILLFPNDILLALIASLVTPWHALISYQTCFNLAENYKKRGITPKTNNSSTTRPGATSSDARTSKEKEDFEIKLGIIIGCVISAFCLVVLILFIIWKCPCRWVWLVTIATYMCGLHYVIAWFVVISRHSNIHLYYVIAMVCSD